MSTMFSWKEVHGGKTPPPGESVGPHERMSWGRTVVIGAQHVVAMFGATFVFPIVMGLDPNLAILFSGISTILFLLIVRNWVPSYLGTSAAFVAVVVAIRSQGGDSSDVTGAILAAGAVLALVGVAVPFAGPRLLKEGLPPAVAGGGVARIGLNPAPVGVASRPQGGDSSDVAGAILAAGAVLALVGVAVHFAGPSLLKKVLPPAVTGGVVMLIGFNLAPVVADTYWPQDQWIAILTTL